MSKNYALHSCVSRVKNPMHSRFATFLYSHTGRKCTDGFEPSRVVLQTTLTTRSCARRRTVFELNELLRFFTPPLLPSQLTAHIYWIIPTINFQDTTINIIKSHDAIGWDRRICPTARWVRFEPTSLCLEHGIKHLLLSKSQTGFCF